MVFKLSKTKIDQLGVRLKGETISESDLNLLDSYRRSFIDAYEFVIETIRNNIKSEVMGRPAKSTSSIREKLRRESIRLSQVQDIAGCRIVVKDIDEQETVIEKLAELFPDATIVDRRRNPSNGYRAVHLVVQVYGKLIEVQIRTQLQHFWAELSEKIADVFDPMIKYGGGDDNIRGNLSIISKMLANSEEKGYNLDQEFVNSLINLKNYVSKLKGKKK